MIENILLEIINDNPYQARRSYPHNKIEELASSIAQVGLLEAPLARKVNGSVELAFGHLRKRAFEKLNKKQPDKWQTMPCEIRDITDEDMFVFAIEENLKRHDLKPIEVARSIAAYIEHFPDTTEKHLGSKLGMTEANVSNMKRVLRLPEKILDKIDAGTISFTQGRELLIFEELENGENLMKVAIDSLKSGTKSYGESNTVEGLQKAIHQVFSNHYRPLDKKYQGYHWDILFDTRAAGCLQCNHMVKTHPTKTEIAHFCVNEKCWDEHQQKQHDEAAAEAKNRMETEITKRATEAEMAKRGAQVNISQEKSTAPKYTIKKRGTSFVAEDAQGTVIAADTNKANAEVEAEAYFEPVATVINPHGDEYWLNHTYRIILKSDVKKDSFSSDVTAQNLAVALEAQGVKPEEVESIKVWKSTGKPGTSGAVAGGWGKCTESLAVETHAEQIEQDLEDRVDERDRKMEETREKANLERLEGQIPCETCAKGKTCDRTNFYADPDSNRFICDIWEVMQTEVKTEVLTVVLTKDIPADVLEQAKKAAGTRSEVLDVHPLYSDAWRHELKGGYVLLNDVAREMDDPEECTERCVNGFHYAFDSGHLDRTGLCVCTDPKCVTKKKSALTRKKNAEGQIRKKAEQKAIQEAVQGANNRPRGLMMLVIYTQVKRQASYYSSGIKSPETWLWDKLSAGTPDLKRDNDLLFKKLDQLGEEELARLIAELMFYYLVDHGDVATYNIKTELPLKWLGIDIQVEPKAAEVVNGK